MMDWVNCPGSFSTFCPGSSTVDGWIDGCINLFLMLCVVAGLPYFGSTAVIHVLSCSSVHFCVSINTRTFTTNRFNTHETLYVIDTVPSCSDPVRDFVIQYPAIYWASL